MKRKMIKDEVTFKVTISEAALEKARKALENIDALENGDSDLAVFKEFFCLDLQHDVVDLRGAVKIDKI